MKRIHTLLAIGCGLLFAASTCFAQMYTVTDLGTLGGDISVAYGINASEPGSWLVVDRRWRPVFRPIQYMPSARLRTDRLISPRTTSGTLGGPFPYSVAYGINDSG